MYYGFAPYVTVAQKQAKAQKALAKLRKSGFDAKPIEAFRGKIATTFWGKSWCENLESYADYENRVGRGRSYLRNGFICHLGIETGIILAKVFGTSLYTIEITIKTLARERWDEVCARCAGQIGSLMELLQGKFSKEVMAIVCDQQTGLFPSPREISFTCSCPDWAKMCKHVAAVLYGIGRRLDSEPELLFTLRGVDPSELLAQNLEAVTSPTSSDALEVEDVGQLFGIDLVQDGDLAEQSQKKKSTKKDTKAQEAAASEATPKTSKKAAKPRSAKKTSQAKTGPFDPKEPTGQGVRKLRELSGLTQAEFARKLSVSNGSLSRWENTKGRLGLSESSLQALTALQKQLLDQGKL